MIDGVPIAFVGEHARACWPWPRPTTSSARPVAVNLPGTNQERPNWQRKLAPDVTEIFNACDPGRSLLEAGAEAWKGRGLMPSPADSGARVEHDVNIFAVDNLWQH